MAENFLNLKNENDIKVQESPRVPNKMNPKRPMPQRSIIVKIAKVKDKGRILNTARERQSHTRELNMAIS